MSRSVIMAQRAENLGDKGRTEMTGITTAVRGPSAMRPNVAVGDAASNKRNSLLGALVLLAAVQLMVVLDTTIVNVALPSIQRGLGFSISGIAWVVNGYALTFGALLLLGGAGWHLLRPRHVLHRPPSGFS